MTRFATAAVIIATLIAIAAPFFLKPFGIFLISTWAVLTIAAIGLNLTLGYAGQISLAQGAFVGIGAYTVALLTPVGLAAGVVGGAVAGALHHKGLGLSDGARQRLANDLRDGKAAVGVLADERERDAVSAKLAELGGAPETYPLDEAELAQAAAETAEMFGETPAGDAGAGVGASREELEIPASVMQD